MIKVTANSDLDKIKHLPKNIQKSIQAFLGRTAQLQNCTEKNPVVLIIENPSDLDSIKALGLKEKSTFPEFDQEIFGNEDRKYVVFPLSLDGGQKLRFYIPILYLED